MRTQPKNLTLRSVLTSAILLLAFSAVLGAGCLGSQQTATEESFAIPETDEGLPGEGPIRRYEWFQERWRERRSMWAQEVEEKQGALVFLGDSITQGWGEDMGGFFSGVKVANRGIGGDTTRGMLIRLEEDVLALNPSGVVILAGTNDLAENASPQVIAGNIDLIISALEEHDESIPIILCRVFPSSPEKDRPPEAIKEINRLYGKVVHGDRQVTYLDTWTLFADEEGNANPEEFPDLLHPNEIGYARWAAALLPVLETNRLLTPKPDSFSLEPGYELLFNGEDLTGWGYRPTSEEDIEARNRWHASDPNAAEWPILTESTAFPGKKSTDDGRFVARHGRLVVTIPPEGRKIQQLWTTEEFSGDFILKLEFRATPNADSGIFIRGPQLQCRDFLLAGPYKDLKEYRPQEWNEIVVTVRNGVATATCNGEMLEESMEVPDSGPIGLEGDRGQMEYRNIRIRKLN